MRVTVAALLLLGVAAFTQAKLLRLPSAGVNITGAGAFCKEDDGRPQRFLDVTKGLAEQCGGAEFNLGGVILAETATTGGAVEIGINVDRECSGPIVASNQAVFVQQYAVGGKTPFKAPADTWQKMDNVLQTLTDCNLGTSVCVTLSAYSKERSAFVAFFSQDFLIMGCIVKERETKVSVIVDAVADLKEAVVLPDKEVSTLDLGKIFTKVAVKVEAGNLPAIPVPVAGAPAKPFWPRGVAIYMTRRPINPCSWRSVDMRADDELLAFIPINEEVKEFDEFEVDIARHVKFAVYGGGRCLFCGPVTIVVMYDYLGRRERIDQCQNPGYKTFKININCDAITEKVKNFESVDLVPWFRDQGSTTWLRYCYAPHGYKIMKLETGEKGMSHWRFVDPSYNVENKGVARMKIVSEYFNRLGKDICPAFLAKDEAINRLKTQVTEDCKKEMMFQMNVTAKTSLGDEFVKPDFDVKGLIEKACTADDDDTKNIVANFFENERESEDFGEALKEGLCPRAGFMPKATSYKKYSLEGTMVDRAKIFSKKSAYKAIMNGGLKCFDAPEEYMCGHRILNMLMSSAERFSVNFDLYDEEMEEERKRESEGMDDAKKALGEWLEKSDVSFTKDCAKPDLFKPVDAMPAMWKTDDEGLLRGYYNFFLDKWCYELVAVWSCPQCVDAEKEGSGKYDKDIEGPLDKIEGSFPTNTGGFTFPKI